MPSKKTIAAEFKKTFSRYLAGQTKSDYHVCRYAWINQTPNTDDDVDGRNKEKSNITSPLNGPKSADVDNSATTNANNSRKSNENIGDSERGSCLTDELSKYIKFYEKRTAERSSTEEREIESIVGNQQAHPIVGDTQLSLIDLSISESLPNIGDTIRTSQSINDLCIVDSISEAVQDTNDPTLFTIRQTASKNRLVIRSMFTGIQTEHSSIYFNGEDIKPCYIELRDCMKKYRRQNPFKELEWFVSKPNATKPKKPKSQQKPTTNKRKRSAEERKNGANSKNICEIVMNQPVPLIPIEKRDNETIIESAQEISINFIEQKFNDWLQKLPLVQPDNNVDVNEFLQGANLPILTVTEDEVFQLANNIEEPVNKSRLVNSTDMLTQLPQQVNDESSSNEPLDLSIKQCKPQLPQQLNGESSSNEPLDLSIKRCTPQLPLDLSIKRCTPQLPQRLNGESSSNEPLDSSMKESTPMSTDTGFWNEGFLSDSHIGDKRNIGSNVWKDIENTSRTQFNRNGQNDNGTQAPSTSTNLEPNEPTPPNMEAKQMLFPAPEPRSTDEQITKVTPPVIQPCIFNSMDWLNDDHSTDLDYEPSEAEDEEGDESINDQMQFSTSYKRKEYSSPPDPAALTPATTLVIKIPNRSGNSRVVFEAVRTKSFNSAPANVAEPLHISTKTNKSATAAEPNFPFDLMQPASTEPPNVLKEEIGLLFNRPCTNYLNGKNCTGQCIFNHNLPPARDVFENLMLFSNDTVMSMYYHFIVKHQRSFVTYFATVCEVFGRKKMESPLLATVEHCERHKQLSFYMDIYNGLVMMDLSKFDALSKIADCCCQSRIAYTVIVQIIIETEPLYFIELLRKCYRYANIKTHHMMRLLRRIDDKTPPCAESMTVLIDVFDKYSMSCISDDREYKFILLKFKRLAKGDVNLTQRLINIALRDNRAKI